MRFLLTERHLVRGCKEHIAAGLGCGTDYQAVYQPLYAPFDCRITRWFGEPGGGDWIAFSPVDKATYGNIEIQCAHLSVRSAPAGSIQKEGSIIATTGNSGVITTGPHLHAQGINLANGQRFDIDQYFLTNLTKPTMNEDQVKRIWTAVVHAQPSASELTQWKGKDPNELVTALLKDPKWQEQNFLIKDLLRDKYGAEKL